jgi:TRAP-type C4-dicarboxylate transport system permease small subunit
LTAGEVRKKYGIASILLLAWEIWCIRDGWFHAQYEYIGFSRSMAWLSAPILAFCVIMAVSASRALRRQRERTHQNESTDSPDRTT